MPMCASRHHVHLFARRQPDRMRGIVGAAQTWLVTVDGRVVQLPRRKHGQVGQNRVRFGSNRYVQRVVRDATRECCPADVVNRRSGNIEVQDAQSFQQRRQGLVFTKRRAHQKWRKCPVFGGHFFLRTSLAVGCGVFRRRIRLPVPSGGSKNLASGATKVLPQRASNGFSL